MVELLVEEQPRFPITALTRRYAGVKIGVSFKELTHQQEAKQPQDR